MPTDWTPMKLAELEPDELELCDKYINEPNKRNKERNRTTAEWKLTETRFASVIPEGMELALNWNGSHLMYGYRKKGSSGLDYDYEPLPPRIDGGQGKKSDDVQIKQLNRFQASKPKTE